MCLWRPFLLQALSADANELWYDYKRRRFCAQNEDRCYETNALLPVAMIRRNVRKLIVAVVIIIRRRRQDVFWCRNYMTKRFRITNSPQALSPQCVTINTGRYVLDSVRLFTTVVQAKSCVLLNHRKREKNVRKETCKTSMQKYITHTPAKKYNFVRYSWTFFKDWGQMCYVETGYMAAKSKVILRNVEMSNQFISNPSNVKINYKRGSVSEFPHVLNKTRWVTPLQ